MNRLWSVIIFWISYKKSYYYYYSYYFNFSEGNREQYECAAGVQTSVTLAINWRHIELALKLWILVGRQPKTITLILHHKQASKFFSALSRVSKSFSLFFFFFFFLCTGTMIPNWLKKEKKEEKKRRRRKKKWQVFVWKAFERGCKVNLALLRMISKLLFCMVSTCEGPFIL